MCAASCFSANAQLPASDPLYQTISGLGLSACKGILHQHHGQILLEQKPNSGFTIRVEIPIIPPALALGKEKSTEAASPGMWQPQPFA